MTNRDTNATISTFTRDPFTSNASDRIPVVRNPLETPQGMRDVGHGNTDARPFDPKPGER